MTPIEDFEIAPLTAANRGAFIALLEEQADILEPEAAPCRMSKESSDRLYSHIAQTDLCRAFLVYDRSLRSCVTAVTYYPSWTPEGAGLYLEDIVTSASCRRRGHGAFAFAALAALAVQGGYDSLRWECAVANEGAQRFYDRLGGERMAGRQTWRLQDAALLEANATPCSFRAAAQGVCRAGLHEEVYGEDLSARYYRSYSTFNAHAGLHVEELSLGKDEPALLASYLGDLWARRSGAWGSHFDVTVRHDQAWLEGSLSSLGFAPLTYGQGVMAARLMRQEPLRRLAEPFAPSSLPARSASLAFA